MARVVKSQVVEHQVEVTLDLLFKGDSVGKIRSTGPPNAMAAGAIVLVQPTSVGEGSNKGRVWGHTQKKVHLLWYFLENLVKTKISRRIEIYQMDSLADKKTVQGLLMFYLKKWKWMLLTEEIHVLLMVEELTVGGLDEYLNRAQLTTKEIIKDRMEQIQELLIFLEPSQTCLHKQKLIHFGR